MRVSIICLPTLCDDDGILAKLVLKCHGLRFMLDTQCC